MKLIILWVSLWIAYSEGFMFSRKRNHGFDVILETSVKSQGTDDDVPETKTILQKLDHFNPTDQTVWSQNYWQFDKFYEKNGPVFLLINGESEAKPHFAPKYSWYSFVAKYKAFGFFLEHRFYGKSQPFSNMTAGKLTHLNSEQAMADTACFIESMNREHGFPNGTKWIMFGGSYAGSLTAWMRIKYPHLVHGGYAASAPLLAQANFPEYLQVVIKSLASYKTECVSAITRATRRVETIVKTKIGRKKLQKIFNLCHELTGDKNISLFFSLFADEFSYAVQYNDPERNPGIKTLCDIMLNKTDTLMERYGKVIGYSKTKCLSINYEATIEYIKQKYQMMNAWYYQTCTEFGWYQTSSKRSDPFGQHLTLPFFTDACKDLFGPKFDVNLLNEGIKRTNIFFGDFNIQVTRVLFTHGSVDPWHELGITNPNSNKPFDVVYINGTSHCSDFYMASESDSPKMKEARVKIDHIIHSWLDSPK